LLSAGLELPVIDDCGAARGEEKASNTVEARRPAMTAAGANFVSINTSMHRGTDAMLSG
jgi:hypothetical protein